MKDNNFYYSVNRRPRLDPELFIITYNAVKNFNEAQERKSWDKAWEKAAEKARAEGKPIEVQFLGMSMTPVSRDYLQSTVKLGTPSEIMDHTATAKQQDEWDKRMEKIIKDIEHLERDKKAYMSPEELKEAAERFAKEANLDLDEMEAQAQRDSEEFNYLWNNPDEWLQSEEVLEGIKTDAGEDFWWDTKGFILQEFQSQEQFWFNEYYMEPFLLKRLAVDGAYPDTDAVDWEDEVELFCHTWLTREQHEQIGDRFSRVHMDLSDYVENRLSGEMAEALERLLSKK